MMNANYSEYFVLLFLILLIIYNVNITQALPTKAQQILRNPILKIFILICIFVFATKYPSVAILLLIAYVLSHSYSQTSGASNSIQAMVDKDLQKYETVTR